MCAGERYEEWTTGVAMRAGDQTVNWWPAV
jgi:hypothetical protein